MASSRNDILWRFIGDTKSLDKANKKAQGGFKKTSKASSALNKSVGVLAGAFAGAKVAQFASDTVQLAIAAEEVDSKFKTVFGSATQFTEALEEWGDVAGVTETQGKDLAATFGNLAQAQGITAADTKDLTLEVATLAGDMASFNDSDPADVFFDLNKALLTTEREGMKKYGIAISEVEVKQRAQTRALEQGRTEANKADRAYASYAIAVEQAGDANGDLARTADSTANRQRQLRAEMEEMQEELGKRLLPAYEDMLKLLLDARPLLLGAASAAGEFADDLSGVTGAVTNVSDALQGLEQFDAKGFFFAIKDGAENILPPLKAADWIMEKMGVDIDTLNLGIEEMNPLMGTAAVKAGQYESSASGVAGILSDIADAAGDAADAIETLNSKDLLDISQNTIKYTPAERQAAREALASTGGRGLVGGHQERHAGGVVAGPHGSNQPIMARGGERVVPKGSNAGSGGGVTINFNGVVGDPVAVAQEISDLLELHGRTNGTQ